MSILIKGMEMPKDIEPGLVIEFADGIDGTRYARLYHYRHGGLTEWLEAVPVPEPHGRLIDADALEDSFEPSDFWNPEAVDNCFAAVRIVHSAPTIIPADPAEEVET